MTDEESFEEIRPYYDHEVHEVLQRMIADPLLEKLVANLWPKMTMQEVAEKAARVNTSMGFQLEFMHPAIRTIVERSSDGLSSSGFENIDPSKAYLFVANHRDILLDSAILQVLLVEHGFQTTEITFGDNLMQPGFITDFGRINRMFTVQREGTSRELYDISKRISTYIRHTIRNKKVSVWIAQRNGRAKDGHDYTQTGLLKMLNISGKGALNENFRELQIVPVSISYEYEPCDALKAQELALSSMHAKYVKAPGEDMNSILTGILRPKGRIHLAVGRPLDKELDDVMTLENDNERIKRITELIDQQIYQSFRLWPMNYIAADLMNDSEEFSSHYSAEQKAEFLEYVKASTTGLKGEPGCVYKFFLKIYGTPVLNKMSTATENLSAEIKKQKQ